MHNTTAECICAAGSEIVSSPVAARCVACGSGYKSVAGNTYCDRCDDLGGKVTTLTSGATSQGNAYATSTIS